MRVRTTYNNAFKKYKNEECRRPCYTFVRKLDLNTIMRQFDGSLVQKQMRLLHNMR